MELGLPLLLAFWALFTGRWAYALVHTRDKPPEWEAPRIQTWPLRLRRDGYRVYLATVITVATLAAVIGLLNLR